MMKFTKEQRAELKALFDIDRNSPSGLVWKCSKGTKVKGSVAGSLISAGGGHKRWRVSFSGKRYYVHRIVWLLSGNDIPEGMYIDHIDRNPMNNRIENLRLATELQNQMNKSVRSDNRSGLHGVALRPYNRFMGHVRIHGKTLARRFDSAEEAAEWSAMIRAVLFGEFAPTQHDALSAKEAP